MSETRLIRLTFHSVNGEFGVFMTREWMEKLRDHLQERLDAWPPAIFTPPPQKLILP